MEQLRQKCLQEKVSKGADPSKAYSALTQSAREWELEPSQPCGGERCATTNPTEIVLPHVQHNRESNDNREVVVHMCCVVKRQGHEGCKRL